MLTLLPFHNNMTATLPIFQTFTNPIKNHCVIIIFIIIFIIIIVLLYYYYCYRYYYYWCGVFIDSDVFLDQYWLINISDLFTQNFPRRSIGLLEPQDYDLVLLGLIEIPWLYETLNVERWDSISITQLHLQLNRCR